MTRYTKDSIVAEAKNLAKMVAETKEVEIFKQAEAKIHENEKVRTLMDQLKKMQKLAVNYQHYGKEQALKKVEEEIEKVYEELGEIPIVGEFQESQIIVNDLLQLIASTITNTVTDEIIISTGGDLLHGETGAQMRNDAGCDGHNHDHDHK